MNGVVFDAFGTLVKIHEGCHPYRQILWIGILSTMKTLYKPTR